MADTLFLIEPGFVDPAFPGQTFYCWHCALLEGVLASFPELGNELRVERVAWPRPRAALVDRLGEAHQSLPVLVLAEGGYIDDKDAILQALAERHGFPLPHP